MTQTLGQYLALIRNDRKMTLREVEEATDRQVSNAYLSQIENDKIRKPSANVLYSLVVLYGINFENLMGMAGYFVATHTCREENPERHSRNAPFAEFHLTEEEETELIDFLQYLRSKKERREKAG